MRDHIFNATNEDANYLRVAHLDLKGLPPKPNRLKQLLKVISRAGYNAILLEWEDSFPWITDYRFRSQTAYTKEQILDFNETAKSLGLEIIPLVPSIGHMETFLSPEDYEYLREVPDRADTLNPLAEGAVDFLKALINEVLELSPDLRYFHLGGDEAETFGQHPQTQEFISKHGKGRLYLHHIEPLLDHLIEKGIRPILWHDMMIDWQDAPLLKLKDKADLAVWCYGDLPNVSYYPFNGKYTKRFKDIGFNLWGSTAYKGADDNTGDLPVLANRIRNAKNWIQNLDEYNYKGMISTAWSRYSTHRPQNEPIDSAIDSLVAVGQILKNGHCDFETSTKLEDILADKQELAIFNQCKSAMLDFSLARNDAWKHVQYFWEQVEMEKLNPTTQKSKIPEITLDILRKTSYEINDKADKIRIAFEELIDDIWIEEYINVRLNALNNRIEEIECFLNENILQVSDMLT